MARGLDRKAQTGFKQAAGMFREITAPYWLAATVVDFGEWLVSLGHTPPAEPLFAEAGQIFEGLDAPSDLKRLSGRAAPSEVPYASQAGPG